MSISPVRSVGAQGQGRRWGRCWELVDHSSSEPLDKAVERWHASGNTSVVLPLMMAIMAIAVTVSSLIVINVVLPAWFRKALGTERMLEIAISGVLVFAMLASPLLAFAAAPKSWKKDERYVRDCREATCT
eukprot:2353833-Prymnesium_polylepis.1